MVTCEQGQLGEVELDLCGPGSLSERLESEGYCIVDDAASLEWCAALEAELRDLHTVHSLLQPSLNRVATSRAGSGAAAGAGLGAALAPPPTGVVCCKTGIAELDIVYAGQLVRSDALDLSPTLHAWWYGDGSRKLLAQINAAAPWLRLTHVDTIKAQFNAGIGGCFPMHFDTTPETSARTLTAILYLSQNWEPDHGGSLRVIPFPLSHVDIPPLAGRLVLFSSTTVLHRVLPAFHPRCVLSIWCAGAKEPTFPSRYPSWVADGPDGAGQVLSFLRQPANARLLCKVLYADEWADSIAEAFGKSSPGVADALALHYSEVEGLRQRISAPLLSLLRETLPLQRESDASAQT